MKNTKVLITGGLGFIGLELTRWLQASGYAVRIMDNLSPQIHGPVPAIDGRALTSSNVEVQRGDVVVRRDLEVALDGVQVVVHLAAETGTGQSMYQIAQYDWVNSFGTAQLLDILANQRHEVRRVVLASSRAVYGEGQYRCLKDGVVQPLPRSAENLKAGRFGMECPACGEAVLPIATRETAIPRPASIYAATKLAQEELVRIGCKAIGMPFSILRFQNVYGPGQSLKNPYTGILSIFSTRIRRGLDLPIFEDGTESRDFVYVTDIARAIGLCLESDGASGKILNVGSGVPTTVHEVAGKLVEALGGRSAVQVSGQFRVGDIRHCYADLTAIRQAVGFEPEVSLGEGLRRFAEWVLTQPLPEDKLGQANSELRARGLMA